MSFSAHSGILGHDPYSKNGLLCDAKLLSAGGCSSTTSVSMRTDRIAMQFHSTGSFSQQGQLICDNDIATIVVFTPGWVSVHCQTSVWGSWTPRSARYANYMQLISWALTGGSENGGYYSYDSITSLQPGNPAYTDVQLEMIVQIHIEKTISILSGISCMLWQWKQDGDGIDNTLGLFKWQWRWWSTKPTKIGLMSFALKHSKTCKWLPWKSLIPNLQEMKESRGGVTKFSVPEVNIP